MRIGIVTGEYPPMQGGVGAYSRILARTFAEQGHNVFVFSSKSTGSVDAAVELTTNPGARWNVRSLQAIRQWATTRRFDVINLQFQTAAYQMSPWIHFLPQWVNVPVVTTFHDLRFPYLFPKAGRLRNWIVTQLARTSTGIIATNHEDWQRVRHLTNTTLIPIGSNIQTSLASDFDPQVWRKKAGAQDSDFLMAHFGFVNRSKGLETLLAGLTKLRTCGTAAKLVMIGGRTGSSDPTNTGYVDEIEALIERLHLRSFVQWTGFVDDESVSAYLKASDAVVLPFLDGASYRRGSLMAAIHHGCTIVTTRPDVLIPTFKNGENMVLIPARDSQALAHAIAELIQSWEHRERLRAGAVALARHFDWTQIAHDCVQFFEPLI
jgi:glycosyltransferase involved in cell wall biosynthesis